MVTITLLSTSFRFHTFAITMTDRPVSGDQRQSEGDGGAGEKNCVKDCSHSEDSSESDLGTQYQKFIA